uniref:PHD-type domain-containing protein n=1 Tax=Photinus pyralis TaxID=7054 RepID=A0A1Y1M9S2_PHOPY
MAANEVHSSDSGPKKCRICRNNAVTKKVTCKICENIFHDSCAKKAEVVWLDNGEVLCKECVNEDNKVTESSKSCNDTTTIKLLYQLIIAKDIIIKSKDELIASLNQQIGLLQIQNVSSNKIITEGHGLTSTRKSDKRKTDTPLTEPKRLDKTENDPVSGQPTTNQQSYAKVLSDARDHFSVRYADVRTCCNTLFRNH